MKLGSPGRGSCRTPYWADYGNPDGEWGGDYRFYQDASLRYNTGLVSTSTMHRLSVPQEGAGQRHIPSVEAKLFHRLPVDQMVLGAIKVTVGMRQKA